MFKWFFMFLVPIFIINPMQKVTKFIIITNHSQTEMICEKLAWAGVGQSPRTSRVCDTIRSRKTRLFGQSLEKSK